jgi:[acyl-carrier-protein] S-malonyltransferase
MAPTLNKFKKILSEINISMPKYEILHNVDSKKSLNINELKEKLLSQLIKPVQWANTMKHIKKSNGIIIECGPGKVLSGLAKANNIDNVYSTSSETFMDNANKIL